MSAVLRVPIGDATSTYTSASYSLDARLFTVSWQGLSGDRITDAVRAAGADARVTEATKEAARRLLRLLPARPEPEIVVEDSGEISFEWYKDRHHVAVLSVDGQHIRWAGMLGPNTPTSGARVFLGEVPTEALDAIRAAL
jgi:hypothetical protein